MLESQHVIKHQILGSSAWTRLIIGQTNEQLTELIKMLFPMWKIDITKLYHDLKKIFINSSSSVILSTNLAFILQNNNHDIDYKSLKLPWMPKPITVEW